MRGGGGRHPAGQAGPASEGGGGQAASARARAPAAPRIASLRARAPGSTHLQRLGHGLLNELLLHRLHLLSGELQPGGSRVDDLTHGLTQPGRCRCTAPASAAAARGAGETARILCAAAPSACLAHGAGCGRTSDADRAAGVLRQAGLPCRGPGCARGACVRSGGAAPSNGCSRLVTMPGLLQRGYLLTGGGRLPARFELSTSSARTPGGRPRPRH